MPWHQNADAAHVQLFLAGSALLVSFLQEPIHNKFVCQSDNTLVSREQAQLTQLLWR